MANPINTANLPGPQDVAPVRAITDERRSEQLFWLLIGISVAAWAFFLWGIFQVFR